MIGRGMLDDAIAYLDGFGSDLKHPKRPEVLQMLVNQLRKQGRNRLADQIAAVLARTPGAQ